MPKKIFLSYLVFIIIASSIGAVDILDWALEHILTWCMFVFILLNKRKISVISYISIAAFLTLHAIGSHYAYNVPIMNDLAEEFWLLRNHYDRIVHFSFGLLLTIPLLEYIQSIIWKKWYLLFWILSSFVLFWCGALYEILEWLVVIIVVPELWQAFLGSQGDIWDAQKDMWLWFIWSIVILVSGWLLRKEI